MKIQTGMSYKQVTDIIGYYGVEAGRNKVDAIPGVMESVEIIMYQWTNKDGSNMLVTFQNDKVYNKAQAGLKQLYT